MPGSMLDAALFYARQGWPIFPITPGAKAPPLVADWAAHASTDPDEITKWWWRWPDANIGFCPENAGLCVVDQDIGGDLAPLKIPLSRRVSTPSGGTHVYLSGRLPSSVAKLAPKVDTRGIGGYVLLPPSSVGGKTYKWRDTTAPIEEIPRHIVAALAPRNPTQPPRPPGFVEDLPGALRRAAEYLGHLAPPTEGQGSDLATLVAAYQLRDFGVSQDVAAASLVEWSGFDEDWVQEKVGHAWKYAQRTEPGTKLGLDAVDGATLGAADFEPPPAALSSGSPVLNDENSKLFYTGQEQQDHEPGQVRELVAGLLEQHCVNYLSGVGSLHKSRLAQQIGLCVHAGIDVFGREAAPAQFVHISYENGRDEDSRRQQAIAAKLGIDPILIADTVYADWRGFDTPLVWVTEDGKLVPSDAWRALELKLSQMPAGHKFLAFDSCYQIMDFAGNSKMSESAVMRAISWLDNQMVRLDATGLMLMHPTYAGVSRGDNSGFSMAWNNRPRVRLSVKAIDGIHGGIELKMEKRNNAPPWHGSVKLMYEDGALVALNDDVLEANYRVMLELFKSGAVGWPVGGGNQQEHKATRLDLAKLMQETAPTTKRLNDPAMLELLRLAVERRALVYQEHNHNLKGDAAKARFVLPALDSVSPLD